MASRWLRRCILTGLCASTACSTAPQPSRTDARVDARATDATPHDGRSGEALTADRGGLDADLACAPPSTGTNLRIEPFTPPAECAVPEASLFSSTVIDSEASFHAVFRCAPEDTAAGVDFAAQRIAVTVVTENPNVSIAWVNEDAQRITVGVSAPPYCGGARPPTSIRLTLVPAGPKPVEEQICRPGPGCPPCPPSCPP